MRVSVFFPVYNDGKSIPELVAKTIKVMEAAGADYEIILVDDGSTDGTKEVVDKLSDDYPKVRAVHHDVNRGYGAALRTGFENARMDWVFYTDGDGQYDVGELPELIKHASNGYDAVVGRKISRSDPMHRKVLGGAYAAFVKSMFGLKTGDVDCDFRLIRRGVLKKFKLTKDSGAVCVELMYKLQNTGARIKEVPVHHYPRKHGGSQFFKPKRVGKTLYDTAKMLVWGT